VHLDLPDSPEAYCQEAGRSGRDGKRSYAALLYDEADLALLEENYIKSFPEPQDIRRIYKALGSYFQLAVGAGMGESFNFDLVAFSKAFNFIPRQTFSGLKVLEQAGLLSISDAVYIPGSFLIKVTREELYDFQLKNPAMELILKTMLRTYTGAFQQHVSFREDELARFLRMDKPVLIKALQVFHRSGIIDYRPARDAPQLTFLQDRTDARNVQIDQKWYDFRKKRARERIDQMIGYVRNVRCRSQLLVAYFGEKDAPACGICDVCTGRTQSQLSPEAFEELKDRIRKLLHTQPLGEKELAGFFRGRDKTDLPEVLTYLLDEGWIESKEGKLHWSGK